MARIKVTLGGCGVNIKDAHGKSRYVLKTPADGPFEVDDAQATYLVGQHVAKYVPEPQEAVPVVPSGDPEPKTGHLDPEQLETMTIEQLKNLAGDIGLDVTGCKEKADFVAAIAAVEVELGDEVDPDDEDGDELPDLNAADPE